MGIVIYNNDESIQLLNVLDTTTTTTQAPYPTCGYNGQRYPVGYNRSEVCSFCTCMDQGNGMYDWTCRHKDCPRLSCENQETPHGKCCPVCSGILSDVLKSILFCAQTFLVFEP